MKTQNVTIEQLSEKLGKSLWIKEDLKRIYLNDAGFNTKKMSTKAYIYEAEGSFKVYVSIDCPSQAFQWIESQENQVRESINNDIENAINWIVNPEMMNEKERIEQEEMDKYLENFKKSEVSYKKSIEKPVSKDFQKTFEIGTKYTHVRFGIGEVTEEDENTVTLKFTDGPKRLLKQFVANLLTAL